MGLFAKIKKFFVKPVKLDEKNKNQIVSHAKSAFGSVKIGTEVVVDEGFDLVCVHFNHVCDKLENGEKIVSEAFMPLLFDSQKNFLANQSRAKEIIADIYFVSHSSFFNNFICKKITISTLAEKTFKVNLIGNFLFKVSNSKKLLQHMCNDYAIVTHKNVEKELSFLASRKFEKAFDKKIFLAEDLIQNKQEIKSFLIEQTQKFFQTVGIEIVDIKTTKLTTKKQNQKELENALAISDVQENLLREIETTLNIKTPSNTPTTEKVCVSKANFATKHSNSSEATPKQSNQCKNQSSCNPPVESNKHNIFFEHQPNNFDQSPPNLFCSTNIQKPKDQVDLKREMPQKNDCNNQISNSTEQTFSTPKSNAEQFKICEVCGAQNNASATKCSTCDSNL